MSFRQRLNNADRRVPPDLCPTCGALTGAGRDKYLAAVGLEALEGVKQHLAIDDDERALEELRARSPMLADWAARGLADTR